MHNYKNNNRNQIIMNVIFNPFVIGGYVSPEYFCDREKETQTLVKYLTNGHNVTLTARRRMGKSGLIMHCFAQPEIKENYLTFFVDIYAAKNLNDFVFLLSKEILNKLKSQGIKIWEKFLQIARSIKPEISFEDNGTPVFKLDIGKMQSPETSLDEIFNYLNTCKKQFTKDSEA